MILTAIREYREKNGFTQEALAVKVGVSKKAISMWENGDRKPNIVMLKKLSMALGCTADELLIPIEV